LIDFSLQIPGYLIVFGILLGCGLARAASGPTSAVTVPRASLHLAIKDQR
jgi:hypothetical protein